MILYTLYILTTITILIFLTLVCCINKQRRTNQSSFDFDEWDGSVSDLFYDGYKCKTGRRADPRDLYHPLLMDDDLREIVTAT